MVIHDVHCHFFSRSFFEVLMSPSAASATEDRVGQAMQRLGWEEPGSPSDLARRWILELDRHQVSRVGLIASIPGDESAVATAVSEHPDRFVGFFMADPTRDDAPARIETALARPQLRCVCLFPAMHRYHVHEEGVLRIFDVIASHKGTAAFVHCGALSVGVRRKLGLTSRFDMRYSNPLDLHSVALTYPDVPIIIPHFGAGLFREALMVADLCSNIYLDTSSSNSWIKYHPGLTLEAVFERALDVVGAGRLLFGTDSSFFPRGWQRPIFESQVEILERLGVEEDSRAKIFSENFNRIFPGP